MITVIVFGPPREEATFDQFVKDDVHEGPAGIVDAGCGRYLVLHISITPSSPHIFAVLKLCRNFKLTLYVPTKIKGQLTNLQKSPPFHFQTPHVISGMSAPSQKK